MTKTKQKPQFGEALFSKREALVYKYITEGKTYKDIAVIMDLSTHTIKMYARFILIKKDVNSRAELTALTVIELREELACVKESCPVCSYVLEYITQQHKIG